MKLTRLAVTLLLIISALNLYSENDYIILENFNSLQRNTFGGWTSAFKSKDSYCKIDYEKEEREGREGYNGKITLYKGDAGYSGFWIQTLDFKKQEDDWKFIDLDGSDMKFITFQIKPLTDSCDFLIKVGDRQWIKKEDAVAVGKLSQFTKVKKDKWQEVIIPVDRFKINTTEFGEVVFESTVAGEVEFLLDDVALKKFPSVLIPLDEPEKKAPISGNKVDRAMWCWHMDDYLDTKKQKDLIKFCKEQNINILWCQIKMQWKNQNKMATIHNEKKWKAFINLASKNNIKVHMLDGFKDYARTRYHMMMLSQVKAIMDYNKKVKKNERFAGIHHDNEVYLCNEWNKGMEEQKDLLSQSLTLIKKIKALLKRDRTGLVYGVDIPFWYDQADTEEGEGYYLMFDGKYSPVTEHFIRLCDNVGIMDYRKFAAGPDGIITHGKGEVEAATKMNKKCIFIGVETIKIEPDKITFFGMTRPQMEGELRLVLDEFGNKKGFQGFAIHHYRTYKEMKE